MKFIFCLILLYVYECQSKSSNLWSKRSRNLNQLDRSDGIEVRVLTNGIKDPKVEVVGKSVYDIDDKGIKLFKLTEENLKWACQVMQDKWPDEVALKDSYMHRRWSWDNVQIVLTPIKFRIIQVTSQPVSFKVAEHKNKNAKRSHFKLESTLQVANSVANQWSVSGAGAISQTISYSIAFLGAGVTGSTGFSYTQNWGHSNTKTTSVTIGQLTGYETDLDPGERVRVVVNTSKGIIQLEITYQAVLDGSLAYHYNERHHGHYYWSANITEALEAIRKPFQIIFKEKITIENYFNSAVEAYDPDAVSYSCISRKEINSMVVYNRTSLDFYYSSGFTQSIDECWSLCAKDENCVAITWTSSPDKDQINCWFFNCDFDLQSNNVTDYISYSLAPLDQIIKNGNIRWKKYCDFDGNEMATLKIPREQCGSRCEMNEKCNYFNWRDGICSLKHLNSITQSIKDNSPGSICGWIANRL